MCSAVLFAFNHNILYKEYVTIHSTIFTILTFSGRERENRERNRREREREVVLSSKMCRRVTRHFTVSRMNTSILVPDKSRRTVTACLTRLGFVTVIATTMKTSHVIASPGTWIDTGCVNGTSWTGCCRCFLNFSSAKESRVVVTCITG